MAGQKAVQEEKKETEESKPTGKRSRSQAEIDGIRKSGKQLAEDGNVRTSSSIKWSVKSQTILGLWWIVTLSTLGLVCQCDANQGGRQMCKHVCAVHRILEKEWWSGRVRKRIRIERRKPRCKTPGCKSEYVVENGIRECKTKDDVHRYLCRTCGHSFSDTIEGFERVHCRPSVIAQSLSLMAAKMSTDEACEQLKMHNIRVSARTLARWAKRYAPLMDGYSSTLRVDAGFQWHVDELHIKIRGQVRYLFGVMDGASHFILSYEISPVKQGVDPTNLFAAAVARSMRPPRILVSDGLKEFRRAAKKVFYRAAGPRFVHVQEIHLKNIFNHNNVYERLNGEFRARFNCARGLNLESSVIIQLYITYHNFFRGHTALDGRMTPAEAIGIDIMPVQDSELSAECDRWITFIQNAAIHDASA